MNSRAVIREARPSDIDDLLGLWDLLFDEPGDWHVAARAWFASCVADRTVAYFPVVEIDDHVIATGIATVESGVPNPHCPNGTSVRLSNLVTAPAHRRKGWGQALVDRVIVWARSVGADRVDLSASQAGISLYRRAGFVPVSAPRMKLVL